MDRPVWLCSHIDMLFGEFASCASAFNALVIAPSCDAIAATEPAVTRRVLDLPDYLKRVHARESRKALVLSLAGIWETNFREHMRKSASIFARGTGIGAKIEDCQIPKLERYFAQMRGFPLDTVDRYPRIRALYTIANAARHGNGRSASEAYRDYPEYFSDERPHAGFYSYALHGATPKSDVRNIDISADQLKAFASDVEGFWRALRELAKNGDDTWR